MRFFLMVLAYLSPVFIVRILWPRTSRRGQPAHYWPFAIAAIVAAVLAAFGLISFVIAMLGLTSECSNVWQCDIARNFDVNRWLFLGCGFLGAALSCGAVWICDRIAART